MANWTWAAASECGTAHHDIGDRRQDAFRVVAATAGFLITIVCDGAGSATHGRYGAVLTARLMSSRSKDWIADHATLPDPAMIQLWAAEARLRIIAAATQIGCTTGEFATTLVMVISNGMSTVTAQVGDGFVVARCSTTGNLIAMSWPESGEFAATTYFITDLAPRLRIGIVEGIPIDRLAVSSDGLERLALDLSGRVAHRPFFERMFDAVGSGAAIGRNHVLSRRLAAFLRSEPVSSRTDDDKTLVLAALR